MKPRSNALRSTRSVALTLAFPCALMACGADADTELAEAAAAELPAVQEPHNVLTEAEQSEGWTLLFDGASLDAWRTYGQDALHDGWQAVDGTLSRVGGGGDIITRETYTDFDLQLEWRVEAGGNSGIFFRASEESGRIFEGAPEMQVLDDAVHADGQNPLTSAGANYGLHPAPRGVVRPAGEWNHVRIRVEGDRVQHWLNGEMIVDYRLGSPEWSELVAASKFAEWPEYGTYPSGHIGLQDHGDPVWYRNMKIRRLEG